MPESGFRTLAAQERDFRRFLQHELIRRTRANPRYSMRAFARTLGADFSSLSKILNGKRPVGKTTIIRMGTQLGLDQSRVQQFVEHGARATALERQARTERARYRRIAADSFEVIADWHHYAILELLRVDGFRSDPAWVARALGIDVEEARAAVARLERLGMVEITPLGNWVDLSEGRSTTLGAAETAAAFRKLQRQVLEKATAALESVPVAERDQSSMTMAIDVDRLPEAKQRITAFRRELARFLSRGERRQEVYNLSISLYPITRCADRAGSKESSS